MTTHTFGTPVDASQYVEDPSLGGNPPQRPLADGPLYVQAIDGTPLFTTTFDGGTGYFSFTTTDVPEVRVSTSNAPPWVPLLSIEAQAAGAVAGATAASALALATTADQKATAALAAAAGSGPKFTLADAAHTVVGPSNQFTVQQLHMRTTDVPLSVNDFSDLPLSAETGKGADLTDFGAPGGVTPLGDDGFVEARYLAGGGGGGGGGFFIDQNPDFSFPPRTNVTSDPSQQVIYRPGYRFTDRPVIGPDTATAYAMNFAAGIPGDDVELYGP